MTLIRSFRLQVAAKYMPVSQLIIGIDLCPIRPIPNVITLVDDITTAKCRTDLKKELKGWKADVFLNDGAPNVGSAWVHDAFTQAELVLSALKLATEFLVEGGTFVTKVFRSKDYNSLLWVFKQLFKTVEATKPASSREVSAEIFVVCRGFLAPSSIDPKFLDPKHVFEELTGKGSTSGQGINILQPDKKQRHRDGYEDDQMILHKIVPVIDFIKSKDPVSVLSTANVLSFDAGEIDAFNADSDLQEYCQDLKVIGRKEFKALLKWRSAVRAAHFAEIQELNAAGKADEAEEENGGGEVDPLKELDDLAGLGQRIAKREKRKDLERKAKQRLRMQLQMENTGDLADDMQEEGLFNIRELKRRSRAAAILDNEDDGLVDEDASDDEGSEKEVEGVEVSDGGEYVDSADEAARWEDEMEDNYQRYKAERLQKDALRFVKQKHAEDAEHVDGMEDGEGMDGDLQDEIIMTEAEEEEDSGLLVDLKTAAEKKAEMDARASLFFSNPIFAAMDEDKQIGDKDGDKKQKKGRKEKKDRKGKRQSIDDEAEGELPEIQSGKKAKKEAKRRKREEKEKEEAVKGIVFVKADPQLDPSDAEEDDGEFDGATKKMMNDPRALSLATQLVKDRRRAKDDLVDASFNRFAFGDTKDLPVWFREDESRHNRPQAPITREAADLIKERLRKLEAQPCKKVLEAKGRNKMRVIKRLEALKKKAAVVAESEDIGGRQKSEQIEKIMRAGRKSTKKEKKVVVAKGKLRGVKGRPKGVKGHYKMVDRRSKKDTRAQKSQAKRQKK